MDLGKHKVTGPKLSEIFFIELWAVITVFSQSIIMSVIIRGCNMIPLIWGKCIPLFAQVTFHRGSLRTYFAHFYIFVIWFFSASEKPQPPFQLSLSVLLARQTRGSILMKIDSSICIELRARFHISQRARALFPIEQTPSHIKRMYLCVSLSACVCLCA